MKVFDYDNTNESAKKKKKKIQDQDQSFRPKRRSCRLKNLMKFVITLAQPLN